VTRLTGRHELLGMTALAPNPRKTVLEASAFEAGLEIALHVSR
jgi:hypothetical protein